MKIYIIMNNYLSISSSTKASGDITQVTDKHVKIGKWIVWSRMRYHKTQLLRYVNEEELRVVYLYKSFYLDTKSRQNNPNMTQNE